MANKVNKLINKPISAETQRKSSQKYMYYCILYIGIDLAI